MFCELLFARSLLSTLNPPAILPVKFDVLAQGHETITNLHRTVHHSSLGNSSLSAKGRSDLALRALVHSLQKEDGQLIAHLQDRLEHLHEVVEFGIGTLVRGGAAHEHGVEPEVLSSDLVVILEDTPQCIEEDLGIAKLGGPLLVNSLQSVMSLLNVLQSTL